MMNYGEHMSGWGWVATSISAIAFWALAIAVIVLLARSLRSERAQQPPKTPEQVLADRFSRGEIDEAEYHDRLAALRRQVHS